MTVVMSVEELRHAAELSVPTSVHVPGTCQADWRRGAAL